MRLVSPTGTTNPDFALKHYTRCGEDDTTVATLSFVGALSGGGPGEKKPANGHEFGIQQKNALASFMLSQGADLKESVAFIESIMRGAGPSAVESILGQKQIAKRWEGLAQLSMALNIQMPELVEKVSNIKRKIQKKIASQVKALPAHMPVECLVLEKGYIRNADDTECQQIPKIAPNVSGAVLMYYDEAQQWLERTLVLSQDELALIVIGECKHSDKSKCNRVQLPVSMNGEPLLLKACLHQMGAKMTQFATDGDIDIPNTDTHVISFTASKDDMAADDWQLVIQSPVKHMMRLLGDDISDVAFVAPPWERSFQHHAKKVQPQHASTVQFHARVQITDLRVMLRVSGNGGVYTCPKTESKKISNDFMIVWTRMSEVDFAVSLAQCDNHYGVVKTFKSGSEARGIRFSKHDFPAAFAKLRPGDSLPAMVASNFFFKVEPIPIGTSNEQVTQWLTSHEWKAKPVRQINATTWLCAAERQFDETFPQWNGMPVLVKWLQPKADHKPIILAGNVQKSLQKIPAENETEVSNEDGVFQSDPWGKWIKAHGTTVNSQAAALPKPSNVTVQPQRRLEAPIEDKFQRQEEQIHLLRTSAEKEIRALKDNMSKLEQAMEGQKLVIDANMEATAKEFKTLRSETQNQFQVVSELFKESLNSAIAAHDGAMSAQFDELKELISASASRGSPLPKKQKNGGDAAKDPYQTH